MSGNAAGAGALQFRDQILALLRDAPAPLSTRAIADRLLRPDSRRVSVPAGLGLRVGDDLNGHLVVGCEGIDLFGNAVYVVSFPPPCRGVYSHLRALEAAGSVIRLVGAERDRAVYWAFLGQVGLDDEHQLAQLETLWDMPTAPPNHCGP
ncbi:hypothetical protein KL864_25555 [Mycolicibacterium goodii]|uniref:hypothetical protein n=1 Tax=Mycolicibacterium goodii TaxID=134601 RepID=UPI001BDD7C41|nr:hypothetical protein [Mycolicibacterium goodii]MBU8819265.1 hypothetical protein [Mycolicibacterium goodii]